MTEIIIKKAQINKNMNKLEITSVTIFRFMINLMRLTINN